MKLKTGGKLPFGSIPVMEIDGDMVAESDAMLRYVGKLTGLYPENLVDAMKVDMVMDALRTIAGKVLDNPDKSEEYRTERQDRPPTLHVSHR